MRYGKTVKKETVMRTRMDHHPVFDESRKKKPNSRAICVGDTESHQGLPFDLPCRLVIHRLLSKFDKKEMDSKRPTGLKGWVIEHEIFNGATSVHVKIIRDGRIAVFVDGEKVYERETA